MARGSAGGCWRLVEGTHCNTSVQPKERKTPTTLKNLVVYDEREVISWRCFLLFFLAAETRESSFSLLV